MSNSYCRGKTHDNIHCDCLSFIQQPNQDPNEPHICRDCRHKQSAHSKLGPTTITSSSSSSQARIQEILSSITRLKNPSPSDSGVLKNDISMPRALYAQADLEANRGLASSSRNTRSDAQGSKNKEKMSVVNQTFQVGEVVLCVDGVIVSVKSSVMKDMS